LVDDEGIECLTDFGVAKLGEDLDISLGWTTTRFYRSTRWFSPELIRVQADEDQGIFFITVQSDI